MTESANISIGTSTNITKPHTIKTDMNINQNLLLKQRVPQSFGILQYIQIQKLMPINLILQLKIIKTTPVKLMFPMDNNFSSGQFGKISKYKDLETEIEQMWHLKPTLIPVVVGALGTAK